MREMVIDMFCGGGGVSAGIKAALGHGPDRAINHDEEAMRMYSLNHPGIPVLPMDAVQADPLVLTRGRSVGLLWMSPDCTDHSNAKGGKPRDNQRRCLADVGITWGKSVKPRVIILENVPEFAGWGPLDEHGQRDKARKGQEFNRWVRQLQELGYAVEWRLLSACDYGAPTSRLRLFLVARCDGAPIVWPAATHGPGLLPYRTAAECIDFSLPCPSIFMDPKQAWQKYRARRPLKENTLRRLAEGLRKFVVEADDPFVVDNRAMFLSKYHGDRGIRSDGRGQGLNEPLLTQDTQNRFALVTAWLMKYYGTNIGSALREPVPTVTGQGNHLALVQAFLTKYYGHGLGQRIDRPLDTLMGRDHFGVVLVIRNEQYVIGDIGLRMLTPMEAMKAHGFPEDYVLVGTRTNMTAKIGNSVPPKMAEVLVRANVKLRESTKTKSA